MRPEDASRIDEILRGARELAESASLEAYLAAVCGDDLVLRQTVEDALAEKRARAAAPRAPTAGEPSSIDERSGGRTGRDPVADLGRSAAGLPERIGGHRILRLLGEGGMGRVYEAEQTSPQRRVAIKVIATGWLSESLARRFEFEVEALGRLNHPGIARIYGAGSETTSHGPQPYFAMELIEDARTLTSWAESQRLTVEQRVRLFVAVCLAIEHAHQRGVVHRDLKPANVLVDASGAPRIVDFGVAKLIAETTPESDDPDGTRRPLTRSGQMIGTVPYMSPEQVGGRPEEIDSRADVYALGVLLHELLTGELPYPGIREASVYEAVYMIQEREPRRLSTWSRDFGEDLETIVLHALAKDPQRRYGTATQLREDLERYLAREPISVRPPSALYHLRAFARRQPVVVATVCAAASILLTAAITITALWIRAERAHVDAERALTSAERRLELARDGADLLLFGVCDELPRVIGTRALHARILEEARTHYLRLAAEQPDDPDEARRVRLALQRLGTSYEELGELSRARAVVEEARRLVLAELASRGDSSPVLGERADLADRLGRIALREARLDDAESLFREQLVTAQVLRALEPERRAHRERLALAEERLGQLARRRGDRDGARERYRTALALREGLVADASREEKPLEEHRLAVLLDELSPLADEQGDASEAAALLERSLAIHERNLEIDPSRPAYLEGLAIALERRGDRLLDAAEREPGALDTAGAAYERGLALRRQLAASESSHPRYQSLLALGLERLARIDEARGDLDTARGRLESALEIARRLARAEPANSDFVARLDGIYRELERLDERLRDEDSAARRTEERVALREELARERPEDLALRLDLVEDHYRLGRIAYQRDRERNLETTRVHYERALALLETAGKMRPDHVEVLHWTALLQGRLGKVHELRGDAEAAVRAHSAALAPALRLVELQPGSALRLFNVSVAYDALGRLAEERGEIESSVERYRLSLDAADQLYSEHPEREEHLERFLDACRYLAEARTRLGDARGALEAWRTRLSVLTRLVARASKDPERLDRLARVYVAVGESAAHAGELDESRRAYENAASVALRLAELGGPGTNERTDELIAQARFELAALDALRIFEGLAPPPDADTSARVIARRAEALERSARGSRSAAIDLARARLAALAFTSPESVEPARERALGAIQGALDGLSADSAPLAAPASIAWLARSTLAGESRLEERAIPLARDLARSACERSRRPGAATLVTRSLAETRAGNPLEADRAAAAAREVAAKDDPALRLLDHPTGRAAPATRP